MKMNRDIPSRSTVQSVRDYNKGKKAKDEDKIGDREGKSARALCESAMNLCYLVTNQDGWVEWNHYIFFASVNRFHCYFH